MNDRFSGYEKAISEHGLKSNILQIPYNQIFKVNDYIKEFVNNHVDLDALFFATNYLTKSELQFFKEQNSTLLNDMGIVDFDDNDMFKIYPISISCVAQPTMEMELK
jgi:LacI family transcriptional regulator